MLPSSDGSSSDRSRTLRRYGPVAAIAAIIAIVVGVVVVSGGDDGDSGDDEAAAAGDEATADAALEDLVPGQDAITFSQAEELGLEVDWPDTCDTESGRLAYPSFFAPECYVPFTGDNGGETDRGVTGASIKVVYYQSQRDPITDSLFNLIENDDTQDDSLATMQGYVDFYEDFFETYGREVELVQVIGSGAPFDEVAARADAVRIDEEIGAFFVLAGPFLTTAFADELGARGISCFSCTLGALNQFYDDHDPFLFGIGGGTEQGLSHSAEYVGKQLAGRPAEHAGDEAFQDTERVFGRIWIETGEDSATANQFLEDELAEYGVEIVESTSYTFDPARVQEQAASSIARLKEAGVTSVIFSVEGSSAEGFVAEATAQNYFPEWVLTGTALTDTNVYSRQYDQEQWAHAFGRTGLDARSDPELEGYHALYNWYYGTHPPADQTFGVIAPLANTFFTYLQATGPNLTHQTYRDAVFAGAQTPSAITAPSLNWGPDGTWDYDDHFGVDDSTEIWWNPDEPGLDENLREGNGMWMFVDGGERHFINEWPEGDSKAFDPEGAVSYYDDFPPGEEPPPYEPRSG